MKLRGHTEWYPDRACEVFNVKNGKKIATKRSLIEASPIKRSRARARAGNEALIQTRSHDHLNRRPLPAEIEPAKSIFRGRNDVKATILKRDVFDGVDCRWIHAGGFPSGVKILFITVDAAGDELSAFNLEGPCRVFERICPPARPSAHSAGQAVHVRAFITSVPIAR